jgi:hypothetical protein
LIRCVRVPSNCRRPARSRASRRQCTAHQESLRLIAEVVLQEAKLRERFDALGYDADLQRLGDGNDRGLIAPSSAVR